MTDAGAGLHLLAVACGRDTLVALRGSIDAAQASDPMAPVTVVVPRGAVGLSARRLLAGGEIRSATDRRGLVNVRFVPLHRLADQVGGAAVAATGRLPISAAVLAAAARAVLAAHEGLLGPTRAHHATEQALVQAYRELRPVTIGARMRLAAQSARAAEVVGLIRAMESRLTGWYDEHDVLVAATEQAGADRLPTDLGAVVWYLPDGMSPAAEHFALALAARRAIPVIVGTTGEDGATPPATTDTAPPTEPTGQLLSFGEPTDPELADHNLADHGATGVPFGTQVISAPSADAEIHAVLREVARRHRAGTALHRMAIAYGGADPYPRVIHDAVTASGFPANGPGVRTLADTVAGRTILGLLRAHERDFARHEVMGWIASAPILHQHHHVPAAAWDSLSRELGITSGEEVWRNRLSVRAEGLAAQVGDPADDEPAHREDRRERTLERVALLTAFLDDVFRRFEPAGLPTSWRQWERWGHRVLTSYLGGPSHRGSWPADEIEALGATIAALGRLGTLDGIGRAPSLTDFADALRSELGAAAPQTGRFGHGILVSPIRLLPGLDLDVVFVVGMIEGAFPTRARDDTLLPDGERLAAGPELPLRGDRPQELRRTYLAALATAPERVLSFARTDQRQGREQRPSRWLLESLAHLAGRERLYSRDLEAPGTLAGVDAFRMFPSLTAAVRAGGEPIDPGDLDLRSLLRWKDGHRGLEAHHLAVSEGDGDPVLQHGLHTRRSRRSRSFTRFDGHVGPGVMASPWDRAVSPTSLETYAQCPRRYLLERALGVAEQEEPEALDRISPADKGRLVHSVLEDFVNHDLARPEHERRRPQEPWTTDDHAFLDTRADHWFAQYEHRGLTGRPLFWHHDRATIRRDLHSFLVADDRYRAANGARPERAEFRFGVEDAPDVAIPVSHGRHVQVKGFADRIDRTADGGLVVIDYKVTKAKTYDKLSESNPTDRGTKLQLALYGLAAQQVLGGSAVHAQYWLVSEQRSFTTIGYDVTPDVLARFTHDLTVIVESIDAGLFPARPGEADRDSYANCTFCAYRNVCPASRARDWERIRGVPELADYVQLTGELGDDEADDRAEAFP